MPPGVFNGRNSTNPYNIRGGQREVKIFDTKRLRVRKLTPKEYGILQAFPMDDWKQVVSDSQAYKQFGNAVTTTVFTAIAEEIAKSIYAAEETATSRWLMSSVLWFPLPELQF